MTSIVLTAKTAAILLIVSTTFSFSSSLLAQADISSHSRNKL
jgi:hypothetical protein